LATELLRGAAEKHQAQSPQGSEDFIEQIHHFRALRRGDIVEGAVVSVDHDGVWVDIGTKSEGVIPPHELQSLGTEAIGQLKAGERVLVYIMSGENEGGQVMLSLSQAKEVMGWHNLEHYFDNGEAFEAEVIGFNKGGLIVNTEGLNGFVPASQIVGSRHGREGKEDSPFPQMVGKKVWVKVIEIDRKRNRLILSQRAAVKDWREQQRDKLLTELHEGEIRKGKVSSIHSFGIFVDIGGADGLVPLSEISWERTNNPSKAIRVGDEVEAYIMKVDTESKRVVLSIRRAQPHPWDRVTERYKVGELVTGRVTNLTDFGAFVRIDSSIEGLIHISELADRRISHPKEVVSIGDILTLRILSIEPERRRMRLSLRQAQEAANSSLEKRDG